VELLQFLISLEKGFLHGLFGIFRVLSYLLSNPEQLSIVSLHELLEGRSISASARLEPAPYRRLACMSAQVVSHLQSLSFP
jgi:hypothetical protein